MFQANPGRPLQNARAVMQGQSPQQGPLAGLMSMLQANPRPMGPAPMPQVQTPQAPVRAPMSLESLNDEYERIKAAQGVSAARAWQRSQMG